MADVFDRYHKAKEIVESMADGPTKEHAKTVLSQLLHMEQGRTVAIKAYQKYCDEMNLWENNLVDFIKSLAKEAAAQRERGE